MDCFIVLGRLLPVSNLGDISPAEWVYLKNFPRVFFLDISEVQIPSIYKELL